MYNSLFQSWMKSKMDVVIHKSKKFFLSNYNLFFNIGNRTKWFYEVKDLQ